MPQPNASSSRDPESYYDDAHQESIELEARTTSTGEPRLLDSQQRPRPHGNATHSNLRLRDANDAHFLFQAVREGHLPLIRQPLTGPEQQAIHAGQVFVWADGEGSLERWTDGHNWLPGRVRGSFIMYDQMPDDIETSERRKQQKAGERRVKQPRRRRHSPLPGGLSKQTYTATLREQGTASQKWHLIAYVKDDGSVDIPSVDDDELLRTIVVPDGTFGPTAHPNSKRPRPHPPSSSDDHSPESRPKKCRKSRKTRDSHQLPADATAAFGTPAEGKETGLPPSTSDLSRRMGRLERKLQAVQVGFADLARKRESLSAASSGVSTPGPDNDNDTRTSRYIRRGSESSVNSLDSNASAFRERFSSSSGSEPGGVAGWNRPILTSEALSLIRTKTKVLEIRLLNWSPDNLSETIEALARLIDETRSAAASHILPYLSLGQTRLRVLLNFAELHTPITSTVRPATPIGRVLSLLCKHRDAGRFDIIRDSSIPLPWAGIRFWMRVIEPWAGIETFFATIDLVARAESVLTSSTPDSNAWVQCVRSLVDNWESCESELSTFDTITKVLSYDIPPAPRSAVRSAVFHLVASHFHMYILPEESRNFIICNSITIANDEEEED